MTIGFDVTHDTIDKNKCYGALVASMDLRQNSSYFSAVSAHQNGEKLSDELGTNTIKAVRRYHELHGKLPDRICFYRGGVGEGQIQYVQEHEVKNLITRLNELYDDVGNGGKPLRLAFIIVCTRINTKLFNKLNGKNPVAGTVVDDIVTLPERCDLSNIYANVRFNT
jgi:aubergine-like protein